MAVINLTGRAIPFQVGEHRIVFPEHRNQDDQIVVLQILTELYDCEEVSFSFRATDYEEGELTEVNTPVLVSRSQVSLPSVGDDDIILVNENNLPACRNMARVYAPHELSAILDGAGNVVCYTHLISS
jgi:hypothetical protein